jgi:hypothetical protein
VFRLLVSVLLLCLAGAVPAGPPAPSDATHAVPTCAEPAGHRHCLRRCTPANLILLPCMAVGAKGMPACREGEVAGCVETCRRRFCRS